MVIFKKEYDGESIVDASRDMAEAFDPHYNPGVGRVTVDEWGFQEGTFEITIKWTPPNK